MDLTPLIAPLVFIGVARLSTHANITPRLASCLAVLPPFLLTLSVRIIYINGFQQPFWPNFITLSDIIIVSLQLVATIVIFKKLNDNDDSLFDWFLWTIGGLLLVIYAIPYLIQYAITHFVL